MRLGFGPPKLPFRTTENYRTTEFRAGLLTCARISCSLATLIPRNCVSGPSLIGSFTIGPTWHTLVKHRKGENILPLLPALHLHPPT